MIRKVIQLLGILLCTLTNAHTFDICGNNNVNVTDILLSPDPPHIGKTLSVELQGKSLVNLENPTIDVHLSILGISLTTVHINTCEYNQCPISKEKDYVLYFNYTLPDKNPGSLPIEVKLEMKDRGVNVGCYSLETEINDNKSIVESISNIDNDIYTLFHYWKRHYEKTYYNIQEETDRYSNFKNNTIYMLLNEYNNIKLRHNAFSDLSRSEYRSYLGYQNIKNMNNLNYVLTTEISTPNEIDWRTKGAVTSVKNQGSCGSCWSFSTTGALEGAYFIKTGNLVSFSEEELVSCDHVDQGCNGGEMDNAFEWIHNNSGLCSEESYSYDSGSGKVGSCRECTPVEGSKVKGFVDVSPTEDALKIAVSKQPVSIAIEADHMSFQFYSDGVYSGNCGQNLDHGVLLVGYGSENGEDYWIVKNSWGESWGNNGYIYIARGNNKKGGECGIELSASYPILI